LKRGESILVSYITNENGEPLLVERNMDGLLRLAKSSNR
jgi:hypothetical protein